MLTRILLYFGIALIDLDLVARALASDMLRLHGSDVATLSETGTLRELQRKYALLAVETGLPMDAQRTVARMAWAFMRAAGALPDPNRSKEFSFYA